MLLFLPMTPLLFMGQEFAQGAEWNEDRGLDWWHLDDPGHRGVTELVRRLNELYETRPALWAAGMVLLAAWMPARITPVVWVRVAVW